jgi:hypothetical protein
MVQLKDFNFFLGASNESKLVPRDLNPGPPLYDSNKVSLIEVYNF